MTLALVEGLTHSAVLGIRVNAQIRMAVVGRVWGQVLVPVLPDAEPGDYQFLSQNLTLQSENQ